MDIGYWPSGREQSLDFAVGGSASVECCNLQRVPRWIFDGVNIILQPPSMVCSIWIGIAKTTEGSLVHTTEDVVLYWSQACPLSGERLVEVLRV